MTSSAREDTDEDKVMRGRDDVDEMTYIDDAPQCLTRPSLVES